MLVLAKLLSPDVFLFKEIQLLRKIFQAGPAKTIIITLPDIGLLLLRKGNGITLALRDITRLAFKTVAAASAGLYFVSTHKINVPK